MDGGRREWGESLTEENEGNEELKRGALGLGKIVSGQVMWK